MQKGTLEYEQALDAVIEFCAPARAKVHHLCNSAN